MPWSGDPAIRGRGPQKLESYDQVASFTYLWWGIKEDRLKTDSRHISTVDRHISYLKMLICRPVNLSQDCHQ